MNIENQYLTTHIIINSSLNTLVSEIFDIDIIFNSFCIIIDSYASVVGLKLVKPQSRIRSEVLIAKVTMKSDLLYLSSLNIQ